VVRAGGGNISASAALCPAGGSRSKGSNVTAASGDRHTSLKEGNGPGLADAVPIKPLSRHRRPYPQLYTSNHSALQGEARTLVAAGGISVAGLHSHASVGVPSGEQPSSSGVQVSLLSRQADLIVSGRCSGGSGADS
jgi:hypothetical protein